MDIHTFNKTPVRFIITTLDTSYHSEQVLILYDDGYFLPTIVCDDLEKSLGYLTLSSK